MSHFHDKRFINTKWENWEVRQTFLYFLFGDHNNQRKKETYNHIFHILVIYDIYLRFKGSCQRCRQRWLVISVMDRNI